MARFRFGQIVSAYIADGRRKTKERPVVIISDDDDYEITGKILVASGPFNKAGSSPDKSSFLQKSHTRVWSGINLVFHRPFLRRK